ncbi:palmitoyltransferase ZDHHC16-like [Tigriopus californicus]|uniref:palmitoyltransferase ZDHHC16-like n=1 Tax=Tigriopus californicus TaxID=6832 RepID=UPI0027DA0EBE|nr:palmitoyltransferase ZDHHC16-like [Tigriopus californicus]
MGVGRALRSLSRSWYVCRITCLSLFYQEFMSWSYVLDTLLEPWFRLGDYGTQALGPLFVLTVVSLNALVVGIAYLVGLPYYWRKNTQLALGLVVVGQWFFVNMVFHFYRAWSLSPGSPPTTGQSLPQVSSICKKCIAPKPPRTHHCSVCQRCHLCMDHHCPWLDNCVGFFNHRHFFLYMVFTVLGCLFLMVFGLEVMLEALITANPTIPVVNFWNNCPISTRSLVIFEAFLTSGCFLILGGLTLWHARLIHRGETSIEAHLNRSETRRLAVDGRVYRNPYDFSPYYNWCLFLGMIDGRGWRHVLLPSTHLPYGTGLEFDSIYSCDIPWNFPRVQNQPKRVPMKLA